MLELRPIPIKLPPITFVMGPFFWTWKTAWGNLWCLLKNRHDFVKDESKCENESSSYDCSRCNRHVYIVYERHYEARITGSTFKYVSMAYTIKGENIL